MKKLSLISLLIWLQGIAIAQVSLQGKIVNENNEALVGAAVVLKETFQGAITNLNGVYTIDNVKPDEYVIQISYLGYETTTDTIQISSENKSFDYTLAAKPFMTDEIVVSATRSDEQTPMAQTTLSKEDIEPNNLGQDMPYLIRLTPSVVTTSDAGAGVGYTGVRIRGSDATRVNVTINGIPLNDPESQGVWWVNMPDFASSVNSIQIQRGVGTSTNGAGAFGGSINLQTNEMNEKPYGEINVGGGSFGTAKANVMFGTGKIGKGFSFDGRVSKINSDGYMDRASSDLTSYYLTGAYHGKKMNIRLVTFGGNEKTYQAWYGVPQRFLDTARTFNPYTYPNEIDNYTQNHYQLLTSFQLSKNWTSSINFHYTHGEGYFEQYKGDKYNPLVNYGSKESLSEYGLNPVITDKGDTISETNLIRRRWLDNDFYGAVFSFNYDANGKLKATLGGGWNQYLGRHFGEVIWSEYASNGQYQHEYYRNDATKTDFNIYGKAHYQITNELNLFGDLQYRSVVYEFTGIDQFGNPLRQTDKLDFWNPKLGLTYRLNSTNELYASVAVANREPNRNDYTQNITETRPTSEQLIDYELGYNLRSKIFALNLNFYYMHYNNQLVVTGEYDNVGEAKRVNVPESYRSGIEMVAGVRPLKWLEFNANVTLSQNKIVAFTEYKDDWSTGGQIQIDHQNTDLAFSPSIVSGQELKAWVFKDFGKRLKHDLAVSLLGKYVGPQYLDNTQNENRKLDAYYVNDFRVEYTLKNWGIKELGLNFTVHNFLNQKYVSNAWVYSFSSPGYDPTPDDPYVNSEGGDNYNMIGYFPNATTYFLAGLRLRF